MRRLLYQNVAVLYTEKKELVKEKTLLHTGVWRTMFLSSLGIISESTQKRRGIRRDEEKGRLIEGNKGKGKRQSPAVSTSDNSPQDKVLRKAELGIPLSPIRTDGSPGRFSVCRVWIEESRGE